MNIYIYNIAELLFLFFWFLKPFYLLPSGSPQLGDYCLVLSFLSWIIRTKRLQIKKNDALFAYFVLCVVAINTAYGIFYQNIMFFLPCTYFIFNLLAVALFSFLAADTRFLRTLRTLTRWMLVVQLAVYVLGLGRVYAEGRYMGTFNDPNQLGFFILSSFFIIKLIDFITQDKSKITDDIMAVALIYTTSSTGMFLGLAIYYGLTYLRNIVLGTITKQQIYVALFLLISGIIVLTLILYNIEDIKYYFKDNVLVQRILEKIEKLFSVSPSGKSSIIDDRNLDKIFLYPLTMLYGSGEAMLERFTLARNSGELHSVPLALLFYYGIIPFFMVTGWIIKKIKTTPTQIWPIAAAVIAESITLINYRQPSFWILFVLFGKCR